MLTAFAVGLAVGLMLWMTGSGINIFTIMFTVMAMVNPIKSIAGVNQQFQRYSDGGKLDLTQQKFVFVALHLVALGVGLWKVRSCADTTVYRCCQHYVAT